jgi:ATP synthase subunit C.
MGCVVAIVFTCFGAAYGTAKAGVGVCTTAVLRPDLIVKSMSRPNAGIVYRVSPFKMSHFHYLRMRC